jgi:uncharacterized protein (TIGR02284 family)
MGAQIMHTTHVSPTNPEGSRVMPSPSHDIKVLHDLIETTIDSAEGYSEAAREAEMPAYRDSFRRRAGEHSQVAQVLQRRLETLGGDPEEGGTIAGPHRMFVNLRRTFGAGEQAVVEEVERGEGLLKAVFEEALHDDELSLPTRILISDTYDVMQSGYRQLQALRRHRD